MKLDPYAACPGGRAKKLKFCCPDLHKELERLGDFLEQRDFANVMPILDQLAPTHPDCACLTVYRLAALAGLGRHDEALELATAFRQREPENPLAITHWALGMAAKGRAGEAWEAVIDACEQSKPAASTEDAESSFSLATLGAGGMLMFIQQLAIQGATQTAVLLDIIWECYFERGGEGGELVQQRHRLREQILGDTRIPLMLRSVVIRLGARDTLLSSPLPKGESVIKSGYDAFALLVRGKWKTLIAVYKQLAGDPVCYPSFLESAARIEIAMGRFDDARQTLEKLIATAGVSEQARVDAVMLSAFLTGDPLGDAIPNELFRYTLSEDAYPLQVIDSSRALVLTPTGVEPVTDENGVAPLREFACLDRPQLTTTTSETPTAETLPQFLAVGALYGKQTDRATRLDIIPVAHRRGQCETMIRELFTDKIVSCDVDAVPSMPQISRTESFAAMPFFYGRTAQQTSEHLEETVGAYYHGEFLSLWCDSPLGLLDGHKPNDLVSEVIGDNKYYDRMLAAVHFVSEMVGAPFGPTVAAALRERLALGAEEPVAIGEVPSDTNLMELVPPWRWGQLDVASLTDPVLAGIFDRALLYRDQATTTSFAEEVLARQPSDNLPVEFRQMAFEHMKDVAMSERNPDEALAWVARAKSEAVANKFSPLTWDVHRATILLTAGRHEEAMPLINTLATHHADAPEVRPFLMWLSQMMQRMEAGGGMPVDGGTPEPPAATAGSSSSIIWTP